jgi:5-methylcytosine-specific restriction enzyme B
MSCEQLVKISHERGWPLISSIVVNGESQQTGPLEGDSLSRFIAADDPQAFLCQQQATFDWAKTAPAELGLPANNVSSGPGGPRFVHYFDPVLEALRVHGGAATPEKVFAWIRAH